MCVPIRSGSGQWKSSASAAYASSAAAWRPGLRAGSAVGFGPAAGAGPDLGVDEVGMRNVQQARDLAHQVLLLRVLARVREGDQPEQLDHALLLLGGELAVDLLRELVER